MVQDAGNIFARLSVLIQNNFDDIFSFNNIVQGGLMMTVFWYYRRQDTDSATTSQFVEVCV